MKTFRRDWKKLRKELLAESYPPLYLNELPRKKKLSIPWYIAENIFKEWLRNEEKKKKRYVQKIERLEKRKKNKTSN